MEPTPFFRKVKTNKDGRPRKQRKGWGRFQSVLRERSADFNLTLDVQNLRQEVQNLTNLRDILCTQSLVQRHSPEGSLSRLVNEYFHVFRKGAVLQESGRKRLVDDRDQRAFMNSMMDEQVEVGNGLCGPDVMMDQMAAYSKFFRFICMSAKVHSIVIADDSVLISVRGSLLFQVLRSSIEMVFPHIMGNEWLVAQLVGQEVEAPAQSTFHFNSAGKCFKYDVDMDFVHAFTSIIKDPLVVDILLGRALIADNAMLGVVDEPIFLEEEEKASPCLTDTYAVEYADEETEKENRGRQNVPDTPHGLPTKAPQLATDANSNAFFQRIVDDYFAAFGNGYLKDDSKHAMTPSEVVQREFLLHHFASPKQVGKETIAGRVKERWRALSECFEVVGFQQKGLVRTDCDNRSDVCLIEVVARYILRINFLTIESVCPHLLSDMPLLDALVGKVITVPSQIFFSIEKSTSRISQIDEKMDFSAALAELLPDQQELSYVLSGTFLTRDGVDCSRLQPPRTTEQPQPDQSKEKLPELSDARNGHRDDSDANSRSMSLADILS